MADISLQSTLVHLLEQSPLAIAGVWVANMYMEKHEAAVQKLVTTFENEVKACEERYTLVFKELMKVKDSIEKQSDLKG